jgi:hypothetical protein
LVSRVSVARPTEEKLKLAEGKFRKGREGGTERGEK